MTAENSIRKSTDFTVCGKLDFPSLWTAFLPLHRNDPQLSSAALARIPQTIKVGGKILKARTIRAIRNQFDFHDLLGKAPDASGERRVGAEKVVWVFVPLRSKRSAVVTLGLGGDHWLQAWVNGESITGAGEVADLHWPPAIKDVQVKVALKAGLNVLAVRFVAGYGTGILALGGPAELCAGDFRSILDDSLGRSARWTRSRLTVRAGGKDLADIGSRRELFLDDFLIEGLKGAVERRMHHPVPRETVMRFGRFGKPWEGVTSGYASMVQDGARIRMYYSARSPAPGVCAAPNARTIENTCVVESSNGIRFTRPALGIYLFNGSRQNNIVWQMGRSTHNFMPFRDDNPAAPPDQRFKAIAYHPEGGSLAAFVSPDGFRWRLLVKSPIITLKKAYALNTSGLDSANLAFWDALRGCYVCYFRVNNFGVRKIAMCTSKDFRRWGKWELIQYADKRPEQMYTNNIIPYFRAPHIYIGFPARFVPPRTKVDDHPEYGISDAVLMSSRDGLRFERWEAGFLRPGHDPEVWTDRNNYPAWGLVPTSPEEISLYWTEHVRHPGLRVRRGTVRTDGFVSLHAGGDMGEMLTRPLVFSGSRLVVNYSTSAVGSLLFEICDVAGKAYPGFAHADSEVLYGNEIAHDVRWYGGRELTALAGKPVRLRIRLHDADLFSLQFAENRRIL